MHPRVQCHQRYDLPGNAPANSILVIKSTGAVEHKSCAVAMLQVVCTTVSTMAINEDGVLFTMRYDY